MIAICCCSIARVSDEVGEVVERLAAIGFDGVELIERHVDGLDDARLRELRARCQDHGLDPLVIAPYLGFTGSRAIYEESLEKARRFAHYASVLGCRKMRVFTSHGAPDTQGSIATAAQWAQGVEGLREICSYDPGLEFVLETHHMNLPDTPENCERLLRDVDAPNLKLLYQPMTDSFREAGIVESYRRLKPDIEHLHLHQVVAQGQGWIEEPGELDLDGFLAALVDEGYDQSLSLEYCWGKAAPVSWERLERGYRYLAERLR